ncbi:DUF397 domain-containing protein [Spongiactinospora sp. TRM90649]|uniref:DUF397 domain-containing protein n=1 Tax=Spongiactinospora sp. TRM90649 TaxID=3031114 RepID=UPI0023FA496D|nr:DUF397 domain-containing protein [Spongiactinospora sp. TRM90649]MDF5752186.1 DUF397 domain-containing protein [Spongiactinospora sp. TRM90649]
MNDINLMGARFRKATASGGNGGECVEVATNLPGVVAVRDSKDPNGPILTFTPDQWSAFLRTIKSVSGHDV